MLKVHSEQFKVESEKIKNKTYLVFVQNGPFLDVIPAYAGIQ
jgi:hypothetical protein